MSESFRSDVPPPYALLELEDINPVLHQPLSSTSRIKYTCVDVSRRLIALGASSGGIYVFSRQPLEFTQLIPNKEGIITRLSISSNEKYISFANGKGLVTVVECSQSADRSQPLALTSREHLGHEVTAMMWSSGPMLLYVGDDVGKVSILQIPTFITKTMFHSTTQVIMNLDSRVCQIDIEHYVLVVSTLTRCYISDTVKEQYRQIGQRLRDGEYGVCFLNCTECKENADRNLKMRSLSVDKQPEVKKYNAMQVDDNFAVSEKLANASIFCGRPGSRLWEASVDGTVQRTHQYKHVLARPPSQVVTLTSYENENIALTATSDDTEGQSMNFAKLFALKNCIIFTYKKDAIYFLNTTNVEHTMWFNRYKDIADCRVYQNTLFLWHNNGSMTSLLLLRIDKYLVKCFLDQKYALCGELCSLYKDYLMSSVNLCPKIHIVAGLKDKLGNVNAELLDRISPVLDKLGSFKMEATQMKSGIYIVDNTHRAQSSFFDDSDTLMVETDEEVKFLRPEAMQVLKDLSDTVTDRLSSSKKKLKEKWEDMKSISVEKSQPFEVQHQNQRERSPVLQSNRREKSPAIENIDRQERIQEDIVYKDSSQPVPNVKFVNNVEHEQIFKSLYQQYKLSLVKEEDSRSPYHILNEFSCDINEVYKLLVKFEEYCKSIDLSEEESKFIKCTIFLKYINESGDRDSLLHVVIDDTLLYEAFVDACVTVNVKNSKINLACECGYPLPYSSTSQTPIYSNLIDVFIEKQWSTRTQTQCYAICKKMPYLWRKILYLRRNEDLFNILLLLLQMLDESLLYSFLPQFTMNTWDRTIQLYSILYTNVCLNCRKTFDSVSVKETLSWDTLGLLLIKSVGGADAVNVMKKHSQLIGVGDLTFKFYHTCLMVAKYEKYDGTVRIQLADALYEAHLFMESRLEILNILRSTLTSEIKNTALPLTVAAKSSHWGLSILPAPKQQEFTDSIEDKSLPTASNRLDQSNHSNKNNYSIKEIVNNIRNINNGMSDCVLCGIPLDNDVLIGDGGLWVFKCSHVFHGSCLDLIKVKLCPSCTQGSLK